MTLIRRPSPFDLVSVRDAMERLFDDCLFRPIWVVSPEPEIMPPLDVYMTPEAVVAKVALPGVM